MLTSLQGATALQVIDQLNHFSHLPSPGLAVGNKSPTHDFGASTIKNLMTSLPNEWRSIGRRFEELARSVDVSKPGEYIENFRSLYEQACALYRANDTTTAEVH